MKTYKVRLDYLVHVPDHWDIEEVIHQNPWKAVQEFSSELEDVTVNLDSYVEESNVIQFNLDYRA